MKYQVEVVHKGGTGKYWEYFDSDGDDDEVLTIAINLVRVEHQKKIDRKKWDMFTNDDPPRATITIREYPTPEGCKGKVLKAKWRN